MDDPNGSPSLRAALDRCFPVEIPSARVEVFAPRMAEGRLRATARIVFFDAAGTIANIVESEVDLPEDPDLPGLAEQARERLSEMDGFGLPYVLFEARIPFRPVALPGPNTVDVTQAVAIAIDAQEVLLATTGLRGAGCRPPGIDDARIARWVPRLERVIRKAGEKVLRRRAACIAIAYGDPAQATRLLAPLASNPDLDPLRDLVAAMASGDDDVTGPWLRHLAAFPTISLGGRCDPVTEVRLDPASSFDELVAVGRAVHVVVGGLPEPEPHDHADVEPRRSKTARGEFDFGSTSRATGVVDAYLR